MGSDKNLRARIRRVVQNRNGSRTAVRFDTSDVIQETEIQLWQKGLADFETESDDSDELDQRLLATIAKGHLSKLLRRQYAKRRSPILEQAADVQAIKSAHDPVVESERRERTQLLLNALDQLDESERSILLLRYFGEFTFADIEQATGLSKQTVRTRYNRAIGNLRTKMKAPLE